MKLLAIDGNSILNRAYYGIRPLSNQKGVYTHAIYGFMNIYLKHVQAIQPDCIAVAFDRREPTFRHKAVETYKANRKGMPEELAMQLPYVKELLTDLGVHVVEQSGYEADDILGTLAKACCKTGQDTCHILTGDRDSLQLVTPCVTVWLVTNKETIPYTPQVFEEEYGFPPISLIDLKALMGDSSDNISGVAGIGKKTATTLIQKWGTVEALYENLDQAGLTKGVYQKLTAGAEAAKQSKWLATIVTDVPIATNPADYQIGAVQVQKAQALLLELELVKLMDKLHLRDAIDPAADSEMEQASPEAPALTTEPATDALLEQLRQETVVSYLFDGETLELLLEQTIYHTQDPAWIFAFLQDAAIAKQTFSAKPHYRWFFAHRDSLQQRMQLAGDGEISAYLLNPTTTAYTIERLCVTYHVPYFEALGEHANLAALPALMQEMNRLVQEQGMEQLCQVELQLTEVLASMEHDGILVDQKGVREFGHYLSEQIEEVQQIVYDEAGHAFNIGSPKQLGLVLFEELQLPHGKKTKTGYSTNAELLESLREQHPIVDAVLKWRQYSKLKSTYVEGLLKQVGSDGRIHSLFKQTETRTGRISSTEPNLQNIPVRTELGRNMRKFFIAKEGCVLLDADYSQIELRILASLCEDTNMQEAFRSGADIHAATAAQVFNMPPELVTSEMRSAAKAVNFGIIYGIGAFSLSKDIGVTVYQANQYIKNYLARYPHVERFMEDVVAGGKENGYVTTLFGRRRPVPELLASNKVMQAAGKRIAMNTPIQGTAADIIKMAMVNVYKRLEREVPQARRILQVHDELIVEVPTAQAMAAAKILGEEMQQVVHLAVPLTADVSMGESWYDAKG